MPDDSATSSTTELAFSSSAESSTSFPSLPIKLLQEPFKRADESLDSETLTEITQRTLDRLVFIRFVEDRMIEPDDIISHLGAKDSTWTDFRAQCKRLDGIYNGIVFKKHPLLDSDDFAPDDDAFADICEALSHKNSAYDFSTVPIHILGNIYERFLGNVIRATAKRAEIEQKPEVRKAGGVYYTPDSIVRYIVDQTVGKLIEGRSPEAVAGMRFADIACGSGSFLLGIYECLLSWHTAYYNKFPNKALIERERGGRGTSMKKLKEVRGDVFEREGTFHLTLQKRREILLNNIYGVDIDAQAVEVAQLSLYLRLLLDETASTAESYTLEFGETLLPSLQNNVKCGNSLIGTDVLHGQFEFNQAEERKLNPMDFEVAFPTVFPHGSARIAETPDFDEFVEQGLVHSPPKRARAKTYRAPKPQRPHEAGFDAVVGNPPYVRPHNLDPRLKELLWERFSTFAYKADFYCCFIERATHLLREGGRFGYIVSNGWLRLNSFRQLRRLLLDSYNLEKIIECKYRVFEEAQVDTSLFVIQKNSTPDRAKTQTNVFRAVDPQTLELVRKIPQKTFEGTFENVFDLSIDPATEAIKDKMRIGPKIGDLFDVCFGLKTGDDEKFLHSQPGLHREDKPLLRGDNVWRYGHTFKGEFVWYVPARMKNHRSTARPGEALRFEQPKILVKDTSKLFAGTYDASNFYVKDVLIVIPKHGTRAPFDLRFVTGIINSRALNFYYRSTFQTLHVQRGELSSLPLPAMQLEKVVDKKRHDTLVRLVDSMLDAHRRSAVAKSEREMDYYRGKCAALDQEIDSLVYALYGLKADEIALVEGRG
jgi:hypothetical protein